MRRLPAELLEKPRNAVERTVRRLSNSSKGSIIWVAAPPRRRPYGSGEREVAVHEPERSVSSAISGSALPARELDRKRSCLRFEQDDT